MKRALHSSMLVALILALGAACSNPSSNPPEDTKVDTQPTDAIDQEDDVLPDTKDDTHPTDLDSVTQDLDETSPDITDVDQKDEKDDQEQPDCVGDACEPDCVGDSCGAPTCDMPCQAHGDCTGKLAGADLCNPERCLWDSTCGSFQCRLATVAGCCINDEDCKDNNLCTINEKCLSDNTCTFENDDANPDCCVNKTLLDLNFEDGAMPPEAKLKVVDYQTADLITWSVVAAPCSSLKALYLGNKDCKTYYNGQLDANCAKVEDIACTELTQDVLCPPPLQLCDVSGTEPKNTCKPSPASSQVRLDLVASELNLPESALITVTFDLWSETEPTVEGSPVDFDLLQLYAKPAGGEEKVLFTSKTVKTTNGFCTTISADLSNYAGQSIDLIWKFDTLDGANNYFEGIYLDNIKVMTYCKVCSSNAQCFDNDPCTVDTCNMFSNKDGEGFCSNVKEDAYCKPCTGVASCQNAGPHPDDEFCWPPVCDDGLCRWDPNPSCCSAVAQLDDYFMFGFETGTSSNGFQVSAPAGSVGWQVVDTNSYTDANDTTVDSYSMYFGNPAVGNYDCGTLQCKGNMITPYIDLTTADSNAYVKLSFQLNLSTEFDEMDPLLYPEDNAHTARIDVLYIEVLATDGSVAGEIWNSDVVHGTTGGFWAAQWADLSEFKGQKVALRFRFDTGDVNPANNDFGGVYVDELRVQTVCDPVCSGPDNCPSATDCSSPTCVDGRCGTELISDCCTATVNPDCNDNDSCTVDSCNQDTKTCSHAFSADPNCCTAYPKLLLDTFVALTADTWTLPNSGAQCGNGLCGTDESCVTCPKDCNQCTVSWRVTDHRSASAPYALYFGNQANWTYANGALAAKGTIVSPVVQLPPYGVPAVSFKLYLDTEHVSVYSTFVEPNDYDLFSIYVESSEDGTTWGAPVLAWNSMAWDLKGSTYDPNTGSVAWKDVSFGLSTLDLNSKYVRFSLTFDSLDSSSNSFEGAYVDDFKVYTLCNQAYECLSPFECEDFTPSSPACSMETCQTGKCGFEPNLMKDGCCAQSVLAGGSFDFDGPCSLESWKADPAVDTVRWQADNYKNHTAGGQCGLYFGNASTHTYDKGASIPQGKATSPTVDVTSHEKIQVSFWLYMDVKDLSYLLDTLTFQVDYAPASSTSPSVMNDAVTIWAKPCSSSDDTECLMDPVSSPCDLLGCGTLAQNQWVYYSFVVDFTDPEFSGWMWDAFPGKYAVFKFVFNSGDALANNGLGVFIDDFQVKSICQ